MSEMQQQVGTMRADAPATPPAEIPDGLDRLGRVLDELLGTAEAVRARVAPVMRETSDPKAPMLDAIPPGSPLGRTIDARITQAHAVGEILGDVLNRLEV